MSPRRLRPVRASGARPARRAIGPAGVAGRSGGQLEVAGGALMRGHDELMERLAAADPVRDREPLTPEAQREADAMLARLLATPATEPRRPRLRPRALAVAGAACVALAVFIAINLLGSKAPGPSVVDRAVAAVTRGGVYHVVELMTVRGPDQPTEIDSES